MKKIFLLTFLTCTVALSASARVPDRGLGNANAAFIEKGSWQIGFLGSYNNLNSEGLDGVVGSSLMGIVDGLSGNATLANLSLTGSWFFADNYALGIRFGYGKNHIDIDNATLATMLPLQNKHIESMHLTGALTAKAYYPLFDTRFLAITGELRLNGKRGYSMNYQETDRGKYGTYSDDYGVSLSLNTGLSLFLCDFAAVEVSMPLLEGGYALSKQIEGGESESVQSRVYATFQRNLLGINAGIVFTF